MKDSKLNTSIEFIKGIGKIRAKASVRGITIVINGIEINETEPPNPVFAIPKSIIAGGTQRKNIKSSCSIF